MKRLYGMYGMAILACIIFAPPAVASLGYPIIPVEGELHDNSDDLAVEEILRSKGYIEDPSGPTANFTLTGPSSLRYPSWDETFQDTSQQGSAPIVSRTWYFGDGSGPHVFSQVNPIAFTYAKAGIFNVALIVEDSNGYSNVKRVDAYVTVYRYAPLLQSDIDALNDLKAVTGMRDIILQHPTRKSFLLGNGFHEDIGFGHPILHNLWPPNPDTGSAAWTCPVSSGDYCESDPLSYTVDGHYLPMYSEDYQSYLGHEFNALHPENSLIQYAVARKGVYDAQASPPFIVERSYGYLNRSVDYAIDNNMAMFGMHILYATPCWAAYAGRAGTLSAADYTTLLAQHVQAMMTHYTDPDNYHLDPEKPRRFSHWVIANEVVADKDATSGDLKDLIKWDNPKGDGPAGDWEEKYWSYYWPLFLLCDPQWNSGTGKWEPQTPAGAADFLMEIFDADHAHAWDPNAVLVLNEYGAEFRWRSYNTSNPTVLVENEKFARVRSVLQHLRSEGSGPDAVGIQTHLATWHFLTYDASSYSGPQEDPYAQEDSLRVNLNQLKNIREALRGLTEPSEGGLEGLRVIISEIDLRMGIPQEPNAANGEMYSISRHLPGHAAIWNGTDGSTLSLRRKWQGRVLEALLNACLAVPELDGIQSWDWIDETSWLDSGYLFVGSSFPNTAAYPDEKASQPGIFGRNPETADLTQRETFFAKPSYYGLRNAIKNYFGKAFIIQSGSGAEVMRFARNGNVMLMTMPATGDTKKWYEHVHASCTAQDWAELAAYTGAPFLVKDATGQTKAAVTGAGDLYLAGNIYEHQSLSLGGGVSFSVQGEEGAIVSQIDEDGNLKMKGYFLVGGLPYRWRSKDEVDVYFDADDKPW